MKSNTIYGNIISYANKKINVNDDMQDQESLTLYAVSPRCIDNREKIQALSLAKECYSMKLDLLTNATVVDDAIRFVAEKSRK